MERVLCRLIFTFGTIGIRELFRLAFNKIDKEVKNADEKINVDTWLNELLWREFYYHILHFIIRRLLPSHSERNMTIWNGAMMKKIFKIWCEGKTGLSDS
jgi:deoxyribodipyrimidine photo-lyase